jgi:hypothetical protein
VDEAQTVGNLDSTPDKLMSNNHHDPQKTGIATNWHATCITYDVPPMRTGFASTGWVGSFPGLAPTHPFPGKKLRKKFTQIKYQ